MIAAADCAPGERPPSQGGDDVTPVELPGKRGLLLLLLLPTVAEGSRLTGVAERPASTGPAVLGSSSMVEWLGAGDAEEDDGVGLDAVGVVAAELLSPPLLLMLFIARG